MIGMVSSDETEAFQGLPAGFDLGDFGHIGHGAAGVEVGQDHLLAIVAEHVGALGHEMHAAENNVLRFSFGGDFGELVAVAGEVGEANHFVALVVVAEQDGRGAEVRACLGDAGVHGVVGKREVVFKAATCLGRRGRGRCHLIKYQVHCIPPSVQPS